MILPSWNTSLVRVLFRTGGRSHPICYPFDNSNLFKVVLSYGSYGWLTFYTAFTRILQ